MKGSVARWGNSLALRLPNAIVRDADLKEGSELEFSIESDAIILRPTRPKYSIDELMNKFKQEHRHSEVDWGGPVGIEKW